MTSVTLFYIPDCMVKIINELVRIHVASSHVVSLTDLINVFGTGTVKVRPSLVLLVFKTM